MRFLSVIAVVSPPEVVLNNLFMLVTQGRFGVVTTAVYHLLGVKKHCDSGAHRPINDWLRCPP